MSEFQVPAKATQEMERQFDIARGLGYSPGEALSEAFRAALPVLAEDPDLTERVRSLIQRQFEYGNRNHYCEEHSVGGVVFRCDLCKERAEEIVAALFGVASPSIKETRDG